MSLALAYAPAVVEVQHDDGWVAACMALSGRNVVAGIGCNVPRVERTLRRFGLPRLVRGGAQGSIGADLCLSTDRAPGRVQQASVDGPLVSVLIPTFNRAERVVQAIASALAQTWPCEVIVVDDGSSDGTPSALAGLRGVRVLRQDDGGKPSALALALKEARGEAVLVLDDDDLLLPNSVRVLATALFAHPRLAAVWADTLLFDGATGAPAGSRVGSSLPGELAFVHALQRVSALPGAMLARRSALDAAGGYEPELIRGPDVDLFRRLARVGPIEGVPLPTYLHRADDGLGAPDDAGPGFEAAWEAASPVMDRREGHAWAAGLAARGFVEEARGEALRWRPPYTPSEAHVRGQLGLIGPIARPTDAVVIVDDGDHGALEETLLRHSEGRGIWVDLEVPRDPLDQVRLHFQGEYAARERLHRWVRHEGPVHLRLSSAPDWAPPPVPDIDMVPDLPGPDALLALAATLDWELPFRTRPGLVRIAHPIARGLVRARLAIRKGEPRLAVHPLAQVRKLLPDWRPGWELSARVYGDVGLEAEAEICRQQAEACRAA